MALERRLPAKCALVEINRGWVRKYDDNKVLHDGQPIPCNFEYQFHGDWPPCCVKKAKDNDLRHFARLLYIFCLQHPLFVQPVLMDGDEPVLLYEVNHGRVTYYVVTAKVEGVQLAEFIGAGNITATQATSLIESISAALTYLEQHDLKHGDLHEENIIVNVRSSLGTSTAAGDQSAEEAASSAGHNLSITVIDLDTTNRVDKLPDDDGNIYDFYNLLHLITDAMTDASQEELPEGIRALLAHRDEDRLQTMEAIAAALHMPLDHELECNGKKLVVPRVHPTIGFISFDVLGRSVGYSDVGQMAMDALRNQQ